MTAVAKTKKQKPAAPKKKRARGEWPGVAVVVPDDYDGSTALPNNRWEAFCKAYTGKHRRNGAASYVAAGYKPGSKEVAAANACRLLTDENIDRRIGFLNDQALAAARLHIRDAVERLGIIATAKITDFLDDNGEIDPQTLKHHPMGAAIAELRQYESKNGTRYHIKLKDDIKALEMLGLTEQVQPPQVTAIQNNFFLVDVE